MTENIANRQSHNATSISSSDMRVLNAIKQITQKGDNAEVRQTKDGTHTVNAVKKSKQI